MAAPVNQIYDDNLAQNDEVEYLRPRPRKRRSTQHRRLWPREGDEALELAWYFVP